MLLFTDTHFNGDYQFFEKNCIFKSDQINEKISKLLEIFEKILYKKKVVQGLIVLDDVKIFRKSKQLIELSIKARHFKLTVIASVQYPKELISSAIRCNTDYFFWSDLNEQGLVSIF